MARQQPLLMLFEDAHWADPSSLELLDRMISQLVELPILLVISFRSEFIPPWVDRAGVRLVTLNRLDRRETAALAAQGEPGTCADANDARPYHRADRRHPALY